MIRLGGTYPEVPLKRGLAKGSLTLVYLKLLKDEGLGWKEMFAKILSRKPGFSNVFIEKYLKDSTFPANEVVNKVYIDNMFHLTTNNPEAKDKEWSMSWKTTECESVLYIGYHELDGTEVPIKIKLKSSTFAHIKELKSSELEVSDYFKYNTLLNIAVEILLALGIETIKITANVDNLSTPYIPYKGKCFEILQDDEDGEKYIRPITKTKVKSLNAL